MFEHYGTTNLDAIVEIEPEKAVEIKKFKKTSKYIRVPSRHEFLQLLFFYYSNCSLNEGENSSHNDDENSQVSWRKKQVEAFVNFGSEVLKKAGYIGIYNGCLEDTLLIGLLSSDTYTTYSELLRFAIGVEDY